MIEIQAQADNGRPGLVAAEVVAGTMSLYRARRGPRRNNQCEGNMTYYIIKIALTTGLVIAVSEISKRSSLFGGLLASLPLVSFLGIVWLYVETRDAEKVAGLAKSVFWLVLPSLPFFLILPYLLKRNVNFYISLGVATVTMFLLYLGMMTVLRRYGIDV
jgi:hypothetical protein